ncbi:hypothetical protein CRM22_000395 [Opisthorchis felineus]|uniref:MD-2-related lipid-recognition domain-containing protein n=1 Tax=Opisthorchis felineus TaxID=147828 RepID=A0A4V3SHA3_OPIFE|nr:hypothetical protein CRM22_000395 [Opisthorchis felineus]
MVRRLILPHVLLWCIQVEGRIQWTDCTKQSNVVKGFTIEECRNEPCTLKAGQTLTGTMVFEPAQAFPVIVPWVRVTGPLGFKQWIKFPSPYVDGCKFTTPSCPVQPGSFYTIDIQTKVPNRKYNNKVQIALFDQGSEIIACVQLHLLIQV